MIRETPDGLKIYASIWKVLLLNLFFAAFVVLGVYELLRPHVDPTMAILDWSIIVAFSCLVALACLLGVPYVVMPKLVTNRSGLVERKLFYKRTELNWSEVAGIGIIEDRTGGRFRPNLRMFVGAIKADEDDLFMSSPSSEQVGKRRNQPFGGLPALIMIPSILLPIRLERMIQRIAQKHAAEFVEYGVFIETPRRGRLSLTGGAWDGTLLPSEGD